MGMFFQGGEKKRKKLICCFARRPPRLLSERPECFRIFPGLSVRPATTEVESISRFDKEN